MGRTVDAETKGPILLFGEEDRSARRRARRSDEALAEHIVEILSDGTKLGLGHGVDGAMRGSGSFLEVDVMVVGSVWGKVGCFGV